MIDGSGVSVDEEKVKVISAFQKDDLMKEDGTTPSNKKNQIVSWYGPVLPSLYSKLLTYCQTLIQLNSWPETLSESCWWLQVSKHFLIVDAPELTPYCEELKGPDFFSLY